MKGNKRLNLPLTAAGVLFCLVLISLHLTSGIYARYSTRAVGSDASRIAATCFISRSAVSPFAIT